MGWIVEKIFSKKCSRDRLIGALEYGLDHSLDFVGSAPYGDQEKDQEMIRQGFQYYKEVFLSKYPASEREHELKMIKQILEKEEQQSPSNLYQRHILNFFQ
jgi:hypothetical protein